MNTPCTAFRRKWICGSVGTGLALFVLALITGTVWCPHFWLTADQRGDFLLGRKNFAEAARSYEEPMRKGVAQYRNGDFEAAAKTFARVPGAEGAFNQGNAWLMHGQYERAMACYGLALQFRPGWKEAQDNQALAAARKAKIDASSLDREKEQTDAYTPDKLVLDQKGGKRGDKPVDLNDDRMSDEAARATWLRRIQTTPGDFLTAKFAYQASRLADKHMEKREETK